MNKRILKARLAYNLSLLKSKFIPVPLLVTTVFTRRCNLSCPYCGTIKNKAKKELPLEEWKKCVDLLYELGNRHISICGGGEPPLRDDLYEFISYISRRPVVSSIMFNGTLLNKECITKLGKSGIMDVGVSVNTLPTKGRGLDLKVFDLLLKNKVHYGYEVTANVLITKQNHKVIPQIIKELIKRKVLINISLIASGKGWWYRGSAPKFAFKEDNKEDLALLIKDLIQIKEKYGYIMQSKEYFNKLVNSSYDNPKWECDAGKYYICINDDGYVMQCEDIKPTKIHYTNLKEHYPLKKKECSGCLWPSYYEESYKRKHLTKQILRLIRLVPKKLIQ